MFVAQQALSRDIARLEQQLGVRLFERSTRRVAMTPEGNRLLPQAIEFLSSRAGGR
jgi:DNA-binding transcriptional LysR family regulator